MPTLRGRGASAPPRRVPARRRTLRDALPDVAGVAWVVAAAAAVLLPALVHGAFLGNFDLLSRYGLSRQAGVTVHYTGPGDQIETMIPWTALAWTQVHHGHLPLWNPYSGLGSPLLFNWQSAAFSLPTAVGYLFPLRLAYTAVQVVTLLLAGSGAYVLGRTLGLGALGAAGAATVFELSGSMTGWLGWPEAGTMAWAGWIFTAVVLVLRGRRRWRGVALLALSLAGALYGGQPESVLLTGIAVVVFVAVDRLYGARRGGERPPVVRPLLDLVLGGAAGLALAAPLVLPGLQVAQGAVFRTAARYGALPPHDLVHLLVPGFEGLPVAGSRWFGNSIYPETAAAVGVVALSLGAVAVATRWRRPDVPGWVAVVVVTAALAYVRPLVSLLDSGTGLSGIAWHRSLTMLDCGLAVLGGIGLDAVARHSGEPRVRRWALGSLVALGVVLALVWAVGRGSLPPAEAAIRAESLWWPAGLTAGALGVTLLLHLRSRNTPRPRHGAGGGSAGESRRGLLPGRWAAAALLAGETAFLVAAGAPLISSSPVFLSPTPAEVALARTVDGALVGFGTRDCQTPPSLGIHPNVNVVFGVREVASYDPMTPVSLFRAMRRATGRPANAEGAPLVLCPAVTDAATARRFGIGYLLVAAGTHPPRGTVRVRTLDGEILYRVPGAADALLSASPAGGGLPPVDAPGTPLTVAHPDPATWRLAERAPRASVVRLHLASVSGWRATVDGRAAPLRRYDGMLALRVPAGRHAIELRYLPPAFETGVVSAAVALAALAAAGLAGWRRRRRRVAP